MNARETREFVVAPLTRGWMEKGIGTDVSLERDESEFEEVGLTESESEEVEAPGVEEAPINLECKLVDEFEVGDHFFLVGEVVNIAADEGAIKNGRINLEDLGSVGHVTGEEFCISDETVSIDRD